MNLIQGTKEWEEWRSAGVGASEVAAIMGICPYNTAYGVWLVKTKRSKGFEGNSFTQHGQEIETKARSRYELLTMDDMPAAIATHPKFEICRASLDGISADGKTILEIKCPIGESVIEDAIAGKVSDHYLPQVQYQLAVTGAELAHFFVYHEKSGRHALVEVKPDAKFQGEIIAKVLDFWEKNVLKDTPPPLTERDAKITDDHRIVTLCSQLKKLKGDASKKAKDESDILKAKVIKLGGHTKIRCGNVLVSKSITNTGKKSFRLTVSEK